MINFLVAVTSVLAASLGLLGSVRLLLLLEDRQYLTPRIVDLLILPLAPIGAGLGLASAHWAWKQILA